MHNNFGDTDECLRSLARQTYSRHSVIVVDNGSSDDSAASLMREWGDKVSFVFNERNLGVGGGYNAGITAALKRGADYVVTCNNDIVVEPEFISALVAGHQRLPNTGIAVPVILYYGRPDLVWSAGIRQLPLLFLSRNLWRNQPYARLRGRLDTPAVSDYVPTCASMISREALTTVGLLDDRFFFGHDDVDWCLRARKLGFCCLVIPEALVRHKVSVTSGVRGSNVLRARSAYTHGLGSVLIGAKHYRGLSATGFLTGLVAIRIPYNVAVMTLSGEWRSTLPYLRGLVTGFARYGMMFVRSEP